MNKIIYILMGLFLVLSQNVIANDMALDLDQFLDLVRTNSKDLKLAEKEIDMAGANKKEAVSTALPKINVNANYDRHLSDSYMYMDMGALTGGDSQIEKFKVNRNNNYGLNAVVSQTIFSPNVYNAIKAAKQYQTLTDFVFDASYNEIITASKKGFYQAILLFEVWQVRKSSEDNAYDNYVNVKNSFDNGLVSEFDLLQAEVRWKDMIPQTTEAQKNYELALISLKNLGGIPVENKLSLTGSLEQYPDIPNEISFESILKSRPDYNALLWEEQLRRTNISAERSGYFPSLTGSFIYSFSSQSDEWEFEEKNNNYIVGLNLSIPIFNGGSTRARVKKARIELDKTKVRIDQSREDIYREITSINLRMNEAFERIKSAQATLVSAEKAFQIAQASAQNGLATQLELKDTRVMFDQASLNRFVAIYDYLAAYFDWQKAIGNIRK